MWRCLKSGRGTPVSSILPDAAGADEDERSRDWSWAKPGCPYFSIIDFRVWISSSVKGVIEDPSTGVIAQLVTFS